ncbi:DUF2087 domain-containing protein [Streptomyces sp. NPDC059582]|uniref:DUF2087 domain-containing protein n=1 Tax=Streptomyces sp. NPDC059582 TaxID=3346875 RepID=UPI003693409A
MPTNGPDRLDQSDRPDRPDPSEDFGRVDTCGRRPEQLIRLFAEESRVRVFAAVALGAGTAEQVAAVAGLSAKETAGALHRLRVQGVVAAGEDETLGVAYGLFRELARTGREERERERERERPGSWPSESADGVPGAGDERADMVLRTFVRDGRLVRLPARWSRKKLVLRHIAEQTFEPGVAYPERVVNDRLRAWCDDGDVDHVTLRRYLVDLGHLDRSEGIYRWTGRTEAARAEMARTEATRAEAGRAEARRTEAGRAESGRPVPSA